MKYVPITEKDADRIADMYEAYLNGGGSIREHIREGITSKGYIGFQAVEEGRLVGFLSGREGIDFTYPHPELEKRLKERFSGAAFYSPDALAVAPGYRNGQVTHALSRLMMEEVRRRGYELLLTELWIYPDGSIPALSPVSGWGRSIYQERIPDFYKDAYRYGIHCPVCGKRCRCGALINVLKVLPKEEGKTLQEEDREADREIAKEEDRKTAGKAEVGKGSRE